MADSTLRKYIWLINTILDAGKITFREIRDKWAVSALNYKGTELSKRTFHNHRVAILTELGVDIECTSMRENSQYYIANEDELKKNEVLNWLADNMATETLLLDNKGIADKIVLEPIPGGREWLPVISQSLRENRMLVFQYTSFHSDVRKEYDRIIEPLCLKLFKRRWYLLGNLPEGEEQRIFALDRITNMRLLEQTFEYPSEFSAQDYFGDFYGICADKYSKPTQVLLKAYREFPKYLESLPLHHSQQLYAKESDGVVYSYHISPAFDFVQEILSHAGDIEVLQPQWLRNMIRDKVQQMSAYYKEKR